MPQVNIEELEKAAKKADIPSDRIISREISGKQVFKGPHLDDWFDNYGECHAANQTESMKQKYAELGLDEYGRTEGQVKLSEAKAVLIKKRQKVLDEAAAINVEIASLKEEDFEKPKTKGKK